LWGGWSFIVRIVGEFDEIERHDPQCSEYLARLDTCAGSAHCLETPEHSQHVAKTQMEIDMRPIYPDSPLRLLWFSRALLEERSSGFAVCGLGRGFAENRHQFRRIRPATSMRSFRQFYRLAEGWLF
jgi:hypothetical protein